MIIQDLQDHKLIELPGPSGDTKTGVLIQRMNLRTTQEEADTIILQQVT